MMRTDWLTNPPSRTVGPARTLSGRRPFVSLGLGMARDPSEKRSINNVAHERTERRHHSAHFQAEQARAHHGHDNDLSQHP